jgi:hypothetical protein
MQRLHVTLTPLSYSLGIENLLNSVVPASNGISSVK